jgi:hypothetical protein
MRARFYEHMEAKLRADDRREDKERADAGSLYLEPAPPLLVVLKQDLGKLPAGISIEFPHDVAIRLLRRGLAVPVGSFLHNPDLVVDEEQLQYADLPPDLIPLDAAA